MNGNICAIVVTYNRKELLLRCLHAIIKQTQPVTAIFIVDNASTDGTYDLLKANNFVSDTPLQEEAVTKRQLGNITCYYLQLKKNTGGAGGFHSGLKGAFELEEFEYFWMMDDDGYPSENCLEEQFKYADMYDYVMPVSVDIENFDLLSWPVRLKNGKKTINYDKLRTSWEEIMPHIFPFNGSLLTRKLVAAVGYPKKELFIWGDEYEHYERCREKGFKPVTIMNAEFYHPANKMSYEPILFGLYNVPYTDVDWRFICLIRNATYLYWNYSGKYKIVLKWIVYSYLFLVKQKFNTSKYSLYLKCVRDGIKGKFDRHFMYMNK